MDFYAGPVLARGARRDFSRLTPLVLFFFFRQPCFSITSIHTSIKKFEMDGMIKCLLGKNQHEIVC